MSPAAQIVVEVSAKLIVDDVQSERVDGGIDERQTGPGCLEDVPEGVEADVEVIPADDVDVTWRPTHDEDDDKYQHNVSHLQPVTPSPIGTPERFTLY